MYCAYNVLFVVATHALALVYPDTAVPVKLPSAFSTLFPLLAASYHPASVHPSLLAVLEPLVDLDMRSEPNFAAP